MGLLRFSKKDKKGPILSRSLSSTASCRHAEPGTKDSNFKQERMAVADEFISGSAFRAILNDDNEGTLLENILTELRPHCTDSQVNLLRSFPSSSTVSLNNACAFSSSKNPANSDRTVDRTTESGSPSCSPTDTVHKDRGEYWLGGEEQQFEGFLARKYFNAAKQRQQRQNFKELVSRPSALKDRQQRQPPVWSVNQQPVTRHSSASVSPVARHSSTSSPLTFLHWRPSNPELKGSTRSGYLQVSIHSFLKRPKNRELIVAEKDIKGSTSAVEDANRGSPVGAEEFMKSTKTTCRSRTMSPVLENRPAASGNSPPTPLPDLSLHSPVSPRNSIVTKKSDKRSQSETPLPATKGSKLQSGTGFMQREQQTQQLLVPSLLADGTRKKSVDKATMTTDLSWYQQQQHCHHHHHHRHHHHHHQYHRQLINCCVQHNVTPNVIQHPGTGDSPPPSCVAQMPSPASCCHSHNTTCAHVRCYSRNHHSCSGTRSSSTIIETKASDISSNRSTSRSISSSIACSDTQPSMWHCSHPLCDHVCCCHQYSPCGGCLYHSHHFHHLDAHHHHHHHNTLSMPHPSSSESTQHLYHRHYHHIYQHHNYNHNHHTFLCHSSQYLCACHVQGCSSSTAGSRGSFTSADSASCSPPVT